MCDISLNINLDIKEKPCLLVGGGKVAERKAKMLIVSGADLEIVSPQVTDGLGDLIDEEDIFYREKDFERSDVDGKYLVIAATSDRKLNKKVSEAAKSRDIPVNVVDDKDLSDFTFTATLLSGNLKIAVSTSGKSPALSASVKERLKGHFGPAYEKYLDVLAELRPKIIDRYSPERRREILLNLGDRTVERALYDGDLKGALEKASGSLPKDLQEIFIKIIKDKGVEVDGRFDHRD
ncbi:MAG: bifunctional precorrin-2 dehydrogenase/sirohydrochlorin ferrochelatase [Thermoplasmata archaeon]